MEKKKKRSRKVQRIRKADGSERVSIKMFLRIPCRQPVTKTDGFWVMCKSRNQHDSRTFKSLYDKIKDIGIQTLVADAGYKTPAIAKLLLDDGITPLLPYKRPMTKDVFSKKAEYVYDEYFDCYVCPNDQVLAYHTTNRSGYRGIQELRNRL